MNRSDNFLCRASPSEAQMEGAVVYGLGEVLYGQITLHEGQVQQSNFHDYRALRMNEIAVGHVFPLFRRQILQRAGRVGEPGTSSLAPAIASAVFAASGQRRRSLPLANHELKHSRDK